MNSGVLSLSRQASVALSPRLQHAIHLLQLSALDFERELQNALASNPFLDECPEPAEPVAPAGVQGAVTVADLRLPEAPYPDREGGRHGQRSADVGDWAVASGDLRQHLRSQLDAAPLHPRDRLAAEIVIETLEEDGYLRDDVAAAAAALGVEPPLSRCDIDVAIAVVQTLDPPGVGARDMRECLRLQLQGRQEPERELAQRILDVCMDLLGRRDFAAIARRTGVAEDAVCRACKLLRRLDPLPGHRYGHTAAPYVTPDVLALRRGDGLIAVANPALRPRAQLNRSYVQLLRGQPGPASAGMREQLREARWTLRNAEQRFVTIERVANAILRRQAAFFLYGDVALRPMALRELALELDLHESTISRATSNKYMATPRGLFELKYFFSREMTTRAGSCSPACVRAVLRELIEAESAAEPLSDVSLATLLREQGIKVARRTVSKYRAMLRMPPADLRRAV